MPYNNPWGPGWLAGIEGRKLGYQIANARGNKSYASGLTALAGGGRTGATPLTEMISVVSTVASGNDSVVLPVAAPGTIMIVVNAAASNSMQVFAQGSDTINGTAGATGVAQAAGKSAVYVCAAVGAWFRVLSA